MPHPNPLLEERGQNKKMYTVRPNWLMRKIYSSAIWRIIPNPLSHGLTLPQHIAVLVNTLVKPTAISSARGKELLRATASKRRAKKFIAKYLFINE
jgi:hypothetical protein